jgi:hypothetical protein
MMAGRWHGQKAGALGVKLAGGRKKITRSRPWTMEELRMLKTLAREMTQTVIARKLKRSVDAMYRLGLKLGVCWSEVGERKGT